MKSETLDLLYIVIVLIEISIQTNWSHTAQVVPLRAGASARAAAALPRPAGEDTEP